MILNKKIISVATLLLFALPSAAFAALCPTDQGGSVWFNCVLTNLLNIVVWPVFITAAIIMFIYAGILFLTAQGEPDKLSKARHAVIWAAVGIAVGILGYVAVGIIRGLLGL